jgi:hypothetical protein
MDPEERELRRDMCEKEGEKVGLQPGKCLIFTDLTPLVIFICSLNLNALKKRIVVL